MCCPRTAKLSGLRSTWQVLCLGPGRMPTLPRCEGGNAPRGYLPGPPALRHLPGRKGGSVCSFCAGLLSFRAAGRQPSARAGNRGTFMLPLRARAPGPCFLFIPCCWIQWVETLPPAPLWRHKRPFSTGAPETLHHGGGEARAATKS